MTRPTRPRDAASLVLLRHAGGGVEVLLGRRPLATRFMPGVYVFPGGGVDAADRVVLGGARLREDVADRVAIRCTRARAHALAMAAVRETFEETGVRVARRIDRAAANAAATGAGGPWQDFAAAALRPALEDLDYVGRAITPPSRPRRFNARFFAAWDDVIVGDPQPSGELEDVRWCRIEETGGLRIAAVTRFILGVVAETFAQGRRPDRLAIYSYRNEAPCVRFE